MTSRPSPGNPNADRDRWIDRLPPGTVIRVEHLARFAWPIDPQDDTRWLVVCCTDGFDDRAYARWFDALPRTGVTVSARDPRLARLLHRSMQGA